MYKEYQNRGCQDSGFISIGCVDSDHTGSRKLLKYPVTISTFQFVAYATVSCD